MHLVVPKSFNDAQDVADKFKDSIPVIVNLQSSDPDLSMRLIDFVSGLTYALDGGMQRIADKVFLLTPRNVEVSAEERAALIEKGFFNQSVETHRPHMQVGFIGSGNMAGALARGWGDPVLCTDHGSGPRAARSWTSSAARRVSNRECAERADLADPRATSPPSSSASRRRSATSPRGIVVSIARARDRRRRRGALPARDGLPRRAQHAGRAAPGRARCSRQTDDPRAEPVKALFARVGTVVELPEQLMRRRRRDLRRRPRLLGAARRGLDRLGDTSRHAGGPSRHTGA